MSKQTHMHIGAHIYTDLLSSVWPLVAIISCSKMFTSRNETQAGHWRSVLSNAADCCSAETQSDVCLSHLLVISSLQQPGELQLNARTDFNHPLPMSSHQSILPANSSYKLC